MLVLTGPALELIRATCTMARDLQPSMAVLEDIDLVAEERTMMSRSATALLQLLNEIDGMGRGRVRRPRASGFGPKPGHLAAGILEALPPAGP